MFYSCLHVCSNEARLWLARPGYTFAHPYSSLTAQGFCYYSGAASAKADMTEVLSLMVLISQLKH